MAMTSYALGLYKDYTKVRVAVGRYKAGSTYKTVPIDSVETLKDGRLAFFMTIPPGDSTGSTVTEVALLDTSKQAMYIKTLVGNEQITFEADDEGALLRVALNFMSRGIRRTPYVQFQKLGGQSDPVRQPVQGNE